LHPLGQDPILVDCRRKFTAADAHIRDYALWIPGDAVAAETPERGRWALEIMSAAMGAETASTQNLSVPDWIAIADR
jgi:nicotinamidase-related amidase